MSEKQKLYIVDCTHCGIHIEVVNPRINEEPKRVYASSFGLKTTNEQVIKIGCPSCGESQRAQFYY